MRPATCGSKSAATRNPGGDRPPELVKLIWRRRIDPGKVFDLALPLEQAAAAYEAMDERRAIKVACTRDRVAGPSYSCSQ